MALIRHKQRSLTALTPHNANAQYLVPNRRKITANTITADGAALPDPVPDGYSIRLTYYANNVEIDHGFLSVGETALATALANLATAAETEAATETATVSAPDIVLTGAIGYFLADATLTEILPLVYGPFSTVTGVTYWLRAGVWTIGFDIDADPDPDLFVPLATFLASAIGPVTRQQVTEQAQQLGWEE
ncbi:hypothetical protein [Shimia aestuarii]|uniref:Uncharacterized protein n=1 Tax=Shimia aestuarii TaxID=254406 RepID=A0A1I4HSA1_9RHOB|nr:hypothetical protein [Shimia aestuarii]SFL44687.1 hypothetical protein SAMN04488042_101231 [Shimia aestuarii]